MYYNCYGEFLGKPRKAVERKGPGTRGLNEVGRRFGEGEHTKENSISNGPEAEWLVRLKWKAWLGPGQEGTFYSLPS